MPLRPSVTAISTSSTPRGLEVVEHLHPELRAFGVLDPDAQNIARTIGQNAQGQVDRLIANQAFFTNFDPQSIKENHRIHRLQWPLLPCANFFHDLIGHGADEVGRDLCSVLLGKKSPDLSDCHPTGIHSDDLVVEAGVTALMLGDQNGRETAVAVAWNIQADRAIAGEYRLAALTVALVGFILWALRARRIA